MSQSMEQGCSSEFYICLLQADLEPVCVSEFPNL